MHSQSIPLYFHKAPIRIYNKIINKKEKWGMDKMNIGYGQNEHQYRL